MTTSGASSTAIDGVSLDYRPDIDGLRALAVLSVVGFHAFPGYFPGGFLGVDIFFVISGYLITGLLLRERENTGRISVPRFYIRRIIRLFPALLLVVASTAIAGYFLLFAHEFARLARHAWASLFFVENLLLASESGYFDIDSHAKPLLHFWSLAVEEQFYIVWPLTLFALARSRRAVAAAIALALAASLAATFAGQFSDAWHFYSPLTRAWELAAGAALAWWHAARTAQFCKPGRLAAAFALLALSVLAASILLGSAQWRHPGYITLAPAMATLVLLATGPASFVARRLLAMRPVVWIGLISYPLYLWHWPLLSYLSIVAEEGRGPPLMRLAMVAASLGLAAATYHLVERPLRYGWPRRRAVAVLIAGAVGLAATTALTLHFRPSDKDRVRAITQDQLEGAYWRFTQNSICDERYGGDYRAFCITNRDAPPDILLFGDSYANHYYAGFLADPRTSDLTVLSYGACEPSAALPGPKTDCPTQMRLVEGIPSIELVLVGGLWPLFGEDGVMTNMKADDPGELADYPRMAAYREALRKRIARLASHDLQVVLVGPKPEPGYDVADCYSRPLRPAKQVCRMDEAEFAEASLHTRRILREIAEEFPNVHFYNPSEAFRDGRGYSWLDSEGVPLLRDDGHLSLTGSRRVVHDLLDWAVQKNIPLP